MPTCPLLYCSVRFSRKVSEDGRKISLVLMTWSLQNSEHIKPSHIAHLPLFHSLLLHFHFRTRFACSTHTLFRDGFYYYHAHCLRFWCFHQGCLQGHPPGRCCCRQGKDTRSRACSLICGVTDAHQPEFQVQPHNALSSLLQQKHMFLTLIPLPFADLRHQEPRR
jgi:hypothetical protein